MSMKRSPLNTGQSTNQIIESLASPNTGFAASFHFAQTACGGLAKPGNVVRKVERQKNRKK